MENDIRLFGEKMPGALPPGYVSANSVKMQIQAHCAIEPNCTWIWGDPGYKLMTCDDAIACMYFSHIYDRSYIPYCHDCEDFARETKSFVSGDWMCGCYALATVFAKAYNSSGNYMFSHAMNLFTCSDGQVYMAEPQHCADIWQMPGVGSWFLKQVAEFKLIMVSH